MTNHISLYHLRCSLRYVIVVCIAETTTKADIAICHQLRFPPGNRIKKSYNIKPTAAIHQNITIPIVVGLLFSLIFFTPSCLLEIGLSFNTELLDSHKFSDRKSGSLKQTLCCHAGILEVKDRHNFAKNIA